MNQRTRHAGKMTSPALRTKPFARTHVWRQTREGAGRWYGGSSITNGAASPANMRVFLRAIPPRTMIAMPTKYMSGNIHHCSRKNTTENIVMMASFAPHGRNVARMIVMRWSRVFSIERAAITAGTPHPTPTTIGMNDLPESPNLRKTRSMMNATRAM